MKTFKRHIIIVLSLCLIAFTSQAQSSKKGNTKKGNFEKQTFVKDKNSDDNFKQIGPPDPGGGGWGAPINGGLYILVAGSIVFWGRKVRNELKDE